MTDKEVNAAFTQGNLTVANLARRYGVARSTIHRHLHKEYKENLPELPVSKVVLLMDATYWGRSFGVIILKDSISGHVMWYKFISKKETIADYEEGINWLKERKCEILAIVCDGLRGLRKHFPEYKFQLCQFHQTMTIRTKLTLHPKLEASQELLALSRTMCSTDKDSFIGAFNEWEQK